MRTTTILLFFTAMTAFGQKKQPPSTFEVNELREVRWVKIYYTGNNLKQNIEDLKAYFKTEDFTRNLKFDGSVFVGRSGELVVKPIQGGPEYNPVTALVRVQVKDERYKVVLSNIKYNKMYSELRMGGVGVGNDTQLGIEKICLDKRKPELKRTFSNINYLKSYDNYFDKKMRIKSIDDDW